MSCNKSMILTAVILTAATWVWAATGTTPATRPATTRPASRPAPSLNAAITGLQIPPAWMAETKLSIDTKLPWSENRKQIYGLLRKGDLESRRQAMKLAYVYAQKGEVQGLGQLLFWGGEIAWAGKEFKTNTAKAKAAGKDLNIRTAMSLASCHRHFGEYDKAIQTLNEALARIPDGPRAAQSAGHIHLMLGDLCALADKPAIAREQYETAIARFDSISTPRPRKFAQMQVKRIRAKMAVFETKPFSETKLTDGEYAGTGLGYEADIEATVKVAGGKVIKIDIKHSESFPSAAPETIPSRIIATQSLKVDAVTGATFTSGGIQAAVLEAITKAKPSK